MTTFESDSRTTDPQALSDAQWRERLSNEQYEVLRQGGTERPWTGELLNEKRPGVFVCAGCGTELFTADSKYDSGCGWPSFYEAINDGAIVELEDDSLGMRRIEIRCAACDGHLGHVFPDGPPPTGLRYCVNSLSLEHVAADEA